MDSLERLGSSVAQVALLVQGLRRERAELAARLAMSAAERHDAGEAWAAELEAARGQVARLELEQQGTPTLAKRAQQAELESAQLASQLDEEKRRHFKEKAALEEQLASLSAQLSAAKELNEILPGESAELELRRRQNEELGRRIDALSAELAAAQGELATAAAKAQAAAMGLARQEEELAALEVERRRLEASLQASAAEAGAGQAGSQALAGLQAELQGLREAAAKNELERADLRRQRRELAGVAKERDLTRRKLQEVYETLSSLRLTP